MNKPYRENIQIRQHLSQIIDKTKGLIPIQKKIDLLLKEIDLHNHCHVANFKDPILILTADSPAWTTRLRFAVPELLDRCKIDPELNRIHSIQCITRPKENEIQSSPLRKPNPISRNNRQLIAETAKTIQDKTLQTALLKLSETDYPRMETGCK